MKLWKRISLGITGLMIALLFIMPFYILIVNSLKTPREIAENVLGWPAVAQFSNYVTAFIKMNFLSAFVNSLLISIISIGLIIFVSSMAAYALVRNKTRASKLVLLLFVAAMIIPFQAVMLPLLGVLKTTFMLNRVGLVFAYVGFGGSLAIFLYHGFIKGIPVDLDEAATIDGCSKFQIFTRIIFPLLKPMHVTVAVLNLIWIWNDFLLPSLIVNKEGEKTLPLQLYYFFGEFSKQWHLALAALTLSVIPIIIFYFIMQKHIIKGVTDGAVK